MEKRIGVTRCCTTALDAVEQYRSNSLHELECTEIEFREIPASHQRLVPSFIPRLERTRECVRVNNRLLSAVLDYHKSALRTATGATKDASCTSDCCAKYHKRGERVAREHQSTAENLIGQFYREWSAEGKYERDECFAPLVATACKYVAPTVKADGQVEVSRRKVFLPGAGFCRLAWDLADAGYEVEACECSHAMLLPAQFIIGAAPAVGSFKVHPFALVSGNITDPSAMTFFEASVPDVAIAGNPTRDRIAISGSDFVGLANSRPNGGSVDVLVTCFFIDTAFNILEYIEAAARLVKPGGVWVNLGPLHWVHGPSESIRLTLDEIEKAVETVGFTFLERSTLPDRHYCSPIGTLMPMVFNCRLWAARMSH